VTLKIHIIFFLFIIIPLALVLLAVKDNFNNRELTLILCGKDFFVLSKKYTILKNLK